MSFILSINAGINSSVGLFKNGDPIICLEEERFNRVKNWFGFPEQALKYLLENRYFKPEELTNIAICDKLLGNVSRERFYYRYNRHYNYGKMLAYNSRLSRTKLELKNKLKSTGLYRGYLEAKQDEKEKQKYNDVLYDQLKSFGLDVDKVEHVEHHLCHAASAYYGSAKSIVEQYLIFTLDGGGDDLRSTVSIGIEGVIERKSATNEYSVGNIYSAITHHLGFRSHEHEYKLMGLAPYVQAGYAEQYKKFFEQILYLDNDDTEFRNPEFINHSLFFARAIRQLGNARFDNIAAGLQAFTEEIVIRWVRGNIKKHGIKKILCAGGVFMNVKLNKLIAQLPEVEYVDVFPSCGDESNIFGAAFYIHNKTNDKKIDLLEKYTLGTEPGDVKEILGKYDELITYSIENDINESIAKSLSEGKIVARCSGRMEFGARALGNRSVLANPSRMQNINKINRSVKKRDFWMPFAPAMPADEAATMIDIPPSLKEQGSPYMMFAFDTKEESRDNIICGIHQADFTARAQIVDKERYPEFYDIIQKFKRITGTSCVLNTSFNLHGFPIVENARQAIDVLLSSEIDMLAIDNYLISRKK